jgi:hypothetical protein
MAAVSCSTFVLASAATAAEPVEWRVQDGGNGHWYRYVSDMSIGWDAAATQATLVGGHLATITSVSENSFVFNYLNSVSAWVDVRGPFLGGYQDRNATGYSEPTGGWKWVTNEPWASTNWSAFGFDEPNDDFGVEDALTTDNRFGGTAVWNDAAFNGYAGGSASAYRTASGYLIEWSADCNNDGFVDYGQIRSGQLADANGNNIPDICEAGFVSWAPSPGAGSSPTVPLRDLDLGEGLAIGIRPNGTLLSMGPYAVTPPSGMFRSVSAGRQCAIAIRSDGALIPFGANEYGRLNVPTGTFTRVSAADATWHAAAIRTDGTVACWGFNNHGQANAPSGTYREIAAGGHNEWSGFTIAIRTNGSIAAWGNNSWGQLGVPSGSNFRRIAAGYYHALAVRNDNTLAGWGWNGSGQASVPSGQFVDVSCGSTESIALRADGTVVVFGSVPDSLVSFFATRSDITKAQIFCCGGAIALESTDCDGNGDFDAVEIAQNPSLDADINGVLDLCESTILVPSQYPTIQAAIDSVPMGVAKVVQVAAGTYNQSFSLNGKDIVVRGAPKGGTTIDGTGLATSVVRFTGGEPATAGIENLVIRNGTAGSIPFSGAPFRVGGGLFGIDSSAYIRNCRFQTNTADYGGGAYLVRCTTVIDDCDFLFNNARNEGGALQLYESSGPVVNSTFAANTANANGAAAASAIKAIGARIPGGVVLLSNCLIQSNTGGNGGAAIEMYANLGSGIWGTMRISNCEITYNGAQGIAGGVRVIGTFETCVIADGTTICLNAPRNISGPYLIEGNATVCDCLADLTLDNLVNGGDLGVVLASWGAVNPSGTGDANHDGTVNGADLALVLASWGACQ